MKRLFNYKNTQFDNQLAAIPHNFAVKHDNDKNVSEFTIYGVIGESWWIDKYTSASDVDNALNEAAGKDILIRLNSPGGSAFDGIAIYNRLLAYKEEFKAKITVRVDGYACSAASVFPLAADEIIMGAGTMYMIHEASTWTGGTKGTFRSQADLLEKLEDGIIDIYATKANVSREEIREKVDAETWFSAREAVEIGFATATTSSVEGNNEEVENLKNQVATLQNEIEQIKNQQKEEPAPQPEIPVNKRKGFFFNAQN